MTAVAKMDANDRREDQFEATGGQCVVCGGWLSEGVPQLAHRVINSKFNQDAIRPEVLHHPMNTIPVDSLRCNSAVIIRGQEDHELIARIIGCFRVKNRWTFGCTISELREAFFRKGNQAYR